MRIYAVALLLNAGYNICFLRMGRYNIFGEGKFMKKSKSEKQRDEREQVQ